MKVVIKRGAAAQSHVKELRKKHKRPGLGGAAVDRDLSKPETLDERRARKTRGQEKVWEAKAKLAKPQLEKQAQRRNLKLSPREEEKNKGFLGFKKGEGFLGGQDTFLTAGNLGRAVGLGAAVGATAGLGAAAIGGRIGIGVLSSTAARGTLKVGGTTAAKNISKAAAGQIPKLLKIKGIGPTLANRIATNTVNAKKTASMISKLGKGVKRPDVIMMMIGSYPFAGFIKEESLQTLSFGVHSAIQNNDLEGAERAIAEQKEIMDPEIWSGLMNYIPFVNVLANLKDFFDAAWIKIDIDEKVVNDMRNKLEI